MFYNERVTTDATPSVKIYEGNQGQAMMKEGAELKKQASNEMQEAKKMEQTALELGISKGMNELWQNEALQSNPKALAEEMDKLAENVTSKTTDTDLKVKVLADFQLKKDSYINNSITKMRKIQEEKRRSATFDSIYSEIDSMKRAWRNGVSGDYTPEDMVNYQYSSDKILAKINARNPDGTYIFSDSQRRAMAKDADQALRQGFLETYAELPQAEQERITKALNDGTYNVENFGIIDLTGKSAFSDIKRDVNNYNSAVLSEKIKQRKYQGLKAVEDFMEDRTQANYDKLVELNPEMSDATKERYREILENTPNYEATTVFEGANDAKKAALEFANVVERNGDYNEAILEDLALYRQKLMYSNLNKKISVDDMNKFFTLALNSVNDKIFAKQVTEVFGNGRDTFDSVIDWGLTPNDTAAVLQIGRLGIEAATDAILMGNKEEAKKIYAKAQQDAIRQRYGDFLIANGGRKLGITDLKEGEIIWNPKNQKAYKFVGYSYDDILIEVDPQTGAAK